MNLELGGETWKDWKGHGSDFRVVEAPKIKGRDIGVTQWTTNLAIRTGANSYALVCCPICHFREKSDPATQGLLLAKKYLNTVDQAKFHAEELLFLNEGLPNALVQLWTVKITTWENDRDAPNPYYKPTTAGASETEVRQRLTLAEEQDQVQLRSEGPDHCTQTKFLLFGLDLEHKQYVSLLFTKPCS